jgi:hypothetical protein
MKEDQEDFRVRGEYFLFVPEEADLLLNNSGLLAFIEEGEE